MTKKLLVIAFVAMYITACGLGKKEAGDEQETISAEKSDRAPIKADEKLTGQLSKFDRLLAAYYDLKNALVVSDRAKAKDVARQIENQATAGMEGIIEDATHIQGTDELEQMREHFEQMSDSMYKLIKEQDMSKPVYRQYCPMAFNNKGAFWLSSEKEIRNPYFGDKMLKCGRVEEEI